MARRVKKRPHINEQEDFFKISPTKLDNRILGTPEDVINYARQNNFIIDKSVDIQKLIEDNNELELIFEDIEEDGQIIYMPDITKYKIIINKNHHKVRQRFTMAHEYIHYQIHRNTIQDNTHTDTILYRDATTKLDIDIIANQYASEILMPTEDFRQVMQQHKGEIIKIAETFNVSSLAVRYRAEKLGLL